MMERDDDPPLGVSLKELMQLLSASSWPNSWLAHQPAVSLREAFPNNKVSSPHRPSPTSHLSAKAQRQLLDFDPVFPGCKDGTQPGFWFANRLEKPAVEN